ncbi:ImuA family protein [Ancylobacter sp.]|uniref:ImuA family protein n=1 Tax=Ancylobacter sp. TaxID=1872567 RepID=UPI003D1057FC
MDMIRDVAALRQMLSGLEAERLPGVESSFSLGADGPEAGGVRLARGALHEVQAAQSADMPAATGFALALALRALRTAGAGEGRPLLWVRQDLADAEFGRLDAPGVAQLGLDPVHLLLVRARDGAEVLRAAGDAARCAGLGALLIETWGTPKALDLTTTRRLALRAASSGVTSFLLHAASQPAPTAVATRWRVAPAASAPLAGDAPGAPAFHATLLRHRGGEGCVRPVEGGDWKLEWDHEACSFRDLASLPRAVVPVPAGRPDGAAAAEAGRGEVVALRRAG